MFPTAGRVALLLLLAFVASVPAWAQDDARTKQLRLLCAQLSGDLTDPGGIAAFRRCLTTRNPLGEIKRDNNIGGRVLPRVVDRPGAKPPRGFGADSRKPAAEGIHAFATSDGRLFYGIDKDGQVWRWDVVTKKAGIVDRDTAAIRLVDADHLLALDKVGVLWREGGDGAGRIGVDREVVQFQAVTLDLVYVLGRDGQLWRDRAGAPRALIDRRVKSFQAVDGDTVLVLGNDGILWREAGTARDGKKVAQEVVAFQYLPPGDTLYVLAKDATLWREVGLARAERIDNDVAAFQAVDTRVAFVLGRDGRLWRQRGNRDQAVLVDRGLNVAAGNGSFQALDAAHIIALGADYRLWVEIMPPLR